MFKFLLGIIFGAFTGVIGSILSTIFSLAIFMAIFHGISEFFASIYNGLIKFFQNLTLKILNLPRTILNLPFEIINFTRAAMLKIVWLVAKILILLGFALCAQKILRWAKIASAVSLWIIYFALCLIFWLAEYQDALYFLENYLFPAFCVLSIILLAA